MVKVPPCPQIKLRIKYIMCDRAGYLNNYGGYGGCNQYNGGSSRGRFNDSQLLKKELHYVETYAKNTNSEYDNNFCDSSNCNYGYGGNNCGFGGGCGPSFVGCPPSFGCAPDFNCGFNGGCPVNMSSFGCGNGGFNEGGCEKDSYKENDDGPCNPFCQPCHKPVCNEPSLDYCGCDVCNRSKKYIQ